jgi:3-deoxy-7-phosphoheptulonate synthase
MSFTFQQKMPSSEEVMAMYPLPPALAAVKKKRDEEIRSVIDGQSDKLLIVIGPCSAHAEDAVCDYVGRLARVQEKVRDKLVLIPRIYTNKPRTTGSGYKGILHQPDPLKAPDLLIGLLSLRRMHLRCLAETGLPAADEMLYPENHTYLDDLLSYVAVGARSVENQQHRLTASGINLPVGMKNPTSGDFQIMLNAIYAAQHEHTFSYQGWQVKTSGNPLAHAILRGAVDRYGKCQSNYHFEDLMRLNDLYQKMDLNNPMVLIDTNHANSDKDYREQPRIASEVLHNRRLSPTLHKLVRGLMIESYIESGSQDTEGNVYGKSNTDACLGWGESEELLLRIADQA